jgi:flavin-dependent dehydrogenase
MTAFDFVIVGAGPAGGATALSLLQRGARVALVERNAEPEDRMGESLRGVAREALLELGVWDAFMRLERRPSHLHRASWAGRLEERDSVRSPYGPDLHLDRARFDALLVEHAVARGAMLFRPALVRDVCTEAAGSRLTLAQGGVHTTIAARCVIDATGRGATVARRFGAKRRDSDRLIGVARRFMRGAREPSTLVEAADDGWWYTAPQPSGRMVALFVTDGDSPAREARREAVWSQCLETAPLTRARLDAAEPAGPARAYLATPGILEWDLRAPVLPVGDAVLSFDPIAADGLCFALRSGIEAAAAVTGARGSLRDYRAGTRSIFDAHLARREHAYASERALRTTRFWQRSRGDDNRHDSG